LYTICDAFPAAWSFTVFDAPTPSHPAPRVKAPALDFIEPRTIRLGTRERRVGGVVYRLLDSLFHAPAHVRAVDALELDVWGNLVNRNTLWSACRRARTALIKLNYPLRVAIDDDHVTLV
jgi:hypothetical protein